jgi:hypothetical protein
MPKLVRPIAQRLGEEEALRSANPDPNSTRSWDRLKGLDTEFEVDPADTVCEDTLHASLVEHDLHLSNLDQDLPNAMQDVLPIYTLDRSWLWCETWCSLNSKSILRTLSVRIRFTLAWSSTTYTGSQLEEDVVTSDIG